MQGIVIRVSISVHQRQRHPGDRAKTPGPRSDNRMKALFDEQAPIARGMPLIAFERCPATAAPATTP